MATITVCDGGCGKQSPNEKGRFIANDWHIIDILSGKRKHLGMRVGRLILCEECYAKLSEALPDAPFPA